MVSAFEENSFYNYSLCFVREMDILPTEITSPWRESQETDGQDWSGQCFADSALSFEDHVSLSQKKLPYTGSRLQLAVKRWAGVCRPLNVLPLYISV